MHSAASPTHNPLAPGMDSPPPWFSKAHALLPHPQWRDPGETQPWAMPIVLEIPKSDPPERTALLEAAAQAVVACCLDPRAAENDSAYRAGLSNWYGQRSKTRPACPRASMAARTTSTGSNLRGARRSRPRARTHPRR